jgi:hypothetical protein
MKDHEFELEFEINDIYNKKFLYKRFKCKICEMYQGNYYKAKTNELKSSECYYFNNYEDEIYYDWDYINGDSLSCSEFLAMRILK